MIVAVVGIVRNGRGSLVSSGSGETVARVGVVVVIARIVLGLDGGLLGGLSLGLLLSGDDRGDVAVGSGEVGGGGGVPRRIETVLGKVLLGSLLVVFLVSRAGDAVTRLLLYLLLSCNGDGIMTGKVAVRITGRITGGVAVGKARIRLESGDRSCEVGGGVGVPRRIETVVEKVLLGSILIKLGGDANGQGDQNQKALQQNNKQLQINHVHI